MTPLAVGRLLRLSLSASAAADVAAGIVVGAGTWPSGAAPWLLIAASLCTYHGGLVLNDWSDREHDARVRPDRPIPSGAVPPAAALLLALLLLGAAPALAAAVHPSLALGYGALSLLAAFYDLLGRGPWIGPLGLAACRGGNLFLGIAYGRIVLGEASPLPADLPLLAAPAMYAAYVFVVSRLGRMEDGEDAAPLGRRPARLVAVLAALLLVLPLVPLPPVPVREAAPVLLDRYRIPLATLVAAAGAFGLLRRSFRLGDWSRRDVIGAMGLALRRLLVVTSTLSLVRGTPAGLVVGAAILLGYPVSRALRVWFPPS